VVLIVSPLKFNSLVFVSEVLAIFVPKFVPDDEINTSIVARQLTSGFQHNVSVLVSVSVKTESVPAVPCAVSGSCARQAQEPGRRVSRAKEWADILTPTEK